MVLLVLELSFQFFTRAKVSSIYRILGECLLISSLPGKAKRMLVESRGLPSDSTAFSKSSLERREPGILFISLQKVSEYDHWCDCLYWNYLSNSLQESK